MVMAAHEARRGCRHAPIVPAVSAVPAAHADSGNRAPDAISWHVARWGDDPFSRGSWSYIRPGGSPADRWLLGEPIDDRFVLCGEAIGTDQPAMTHGAFDSGERAAKWCLSAMRPGERVVVIGAGLAGIGAARTLRDAGVDAVVLEGRNRIGGRVHTVQLPGRRGDPPAIADAGAAWLQQFPRNPFADLARSLGATLVPTDFHRPLAAAAHRPVGDVAAALEQLRVAAGDATNGHDDVSLGVVLAAMRGFDPVAMQHAVDADIVLETGAALDDTSARWFFAEDGVGNDDHIIGGGYQVILDHVAAGLDIKLDRSVTRVAWTASGVTVASVGDDGLAETMFADRCICTIPISLLQRGEPVLLPGLPPKHRAALARIGMGVVDKVVLRFATRWWPVPPHDYFRWYDAPANWCEWVDLTEVCGAPVVAAMIADDAVVRHHRGRTDAEIAAAATAALYRWADSVGTTHGSAP